jgi:hypothetical protein
MRFSQHDQLAIVPQWPSGSGRFLSHDVLKRATGARAIQAHNEKPRLMGSPGGACLGKEACRSWAAAPRDTKAMSREATMTGLPHRPGIYGLTNGLRRVMMGIRMNEPPPPSRADASISMVFRKSVVLEHVFLPRTYPGFVGFPSPRFRRVFGTGGCRRGRRPHGAQRHAHSARPIGRHGGGSDDVCSWGRTGSDHRITKPTRPKQTSRELIGLQS